MMGSRTYSVMPKPNCSCTARSMSLCAAMWQKAHFLSSSSLFGIDATSARPMLTSKIVAFDAEDKRENGHVGGVGGNGEAEECAGLTNSGRLKDKNAASAAGEPDGRRFGGRSIINVDEKVRRARVKVIHGAPNTIS